MAIVKSGLFDKIEGSLEDVTFRTRRNKKIELSKKGIPFDPESPAQLRSDAGYTRLAELNRTATWPNWSKYDELSSLAKISRWNAWVERHMPAMSRGPVAYWGFAEDSGPTLHDFTKNDNHGNLVGPTWVEPEGLWFNGSSYYVSIPSSIVNNLASGTLAAWFNLASTGYAEAFLSFSDASQDNQIIIAATVGNKIYSLVRKSGTTRYEYIGSVFSLNEWHQFVCTWNPSGVSFYLDGTLDGTDGWGGGVGTHTDGRIGRHFTAGQWRYVDGIIAETAILNYDMSTPETKKLYDSTKARFQ